MNLLETILSANNGSNVQQLAKNFGIGEGDAKSAIAQLLPALTSGLKRNTQSQDGLASLLGALSSGNHQRYLDQPENMQQHSTREEGNSILGHIFGSKDVSRQVASQASQKTGLGNDIMKQMLPMVATLAMGALSKQKQQASPHGSLGNQGGGNFLSSLLDADGDGSAVDDILGFAKKFF